MFNGAKLVTVRTLSLDGNSESKDSQPIKLSKSLMVSNQIMSKVNEPLMESPKKKPLEQQSSNSLFGATGNMLQNFSNEINTLKTNTKNALNEIKQPMAQAQQPLIQQEINKIPPQNIIPPVNPIIVPVVKKPTNQMVKNMPLVSDISKKKQDIKPTQTKSSIDTDADLYENFRNDQAPKQPSKPQKTIANPMFNNPNIISTPQKKPIEKELSQNMSNSYFIYKSDKLDFNIKF